MLKANQIPDAVARMADEAYYDTAGENPTMSDEDIMKHAIVAALNAWPGMALDGPVTANGRWLVPPVVVLPLPQESTNAEG